MYIFFVFNNFIIRIARLNGITVRRRFSQWDKHWEINTNIHPNKFDDILQHFYFHQEISIPHICWLLLYTFSELIETSETAEGVGILFIFILKIFAIIAKFNPIDFSKLIFFHTLPNRISLARLGGIMWSVRKK